MNTLEFDSLYLEFGAQRVLSSIHMKCQTGRVVGLLGRNGAGKSCLMKIVLGAMEAEFKSIRFNQQPLTGNYIKRRLIAYLPQETMLPPAMTMRQSFSHFEVSHEKAFHYFPEMESWLNSRAEELSGGQQRLWELLLVLCSPHPFCLLDEPFSGLSPVQVERVVQVMNEIKQTKGFLITDHLHRTVREVADDLYVLSNGATYRIDSEEQLSWLGYLPADASPNGIRSEAPLRG